MVLTGTCYVSRSLSDCEERSQKEGETLALVWACERLHPFVYGRQFNLVTDHKPLETIYKSWSKTCACTERWVLHLQPHEFKVVYVPGKVNMADLLSHLLGTMAMKEQHAHGSDEYVWIHCCECHPQSSDHKGREGSIKDWSRVDLGKKSHRD